MVMLAQILPAQPRPVAGGPPPPPAPTVGQGQAGTGPRRPGGAQQQARKEYQPDELCTIEGQVRNAVTGEALPKASVTVSSSGRQQQAYATISDASGRFTLRGVEPGQYRISVRRNGYVATDQAGSRAISPGATLTLATSQTVKNVLAKLIPHAVVTGRVTDLDGEPLASANVQLMRFKYSQQGQRQLVPFNAAQTNDLGEYRLFGVPPGKYFVGVAPPGRMAYWGAHDGTSDQDAGAEGPVGTYYPGTADPTQATGIDVRMGGTLQGIDVRVLRSRTFRVSGQVMGAPSGGRQGMVMLEPTGAGAASVSQMMRGPMGAPWRQDGKFTVRGVPPGSYSIIVESFENEARLRGTAEVEVGDRNVDNAQVLLQPSFDVTGAVRLEGQGTVEFNNTFVNLQPRQRGGRMSMGGASARVGPDGAIPLRQVFAGHFDIMVGGLPENHYVKSVRAGEVEALPDGLRILPGMQLDVVVSPNGGRIGGNVVNEKGDAVTSALAILIAPNAPPINRFKSSPVDQQGRFNLSGIAPGDYYLAALEEVEAGAYWEPDFLTRNESLIQKISIRESATETRTLKVIAGAGQ